MTLAGDNAIRRQENRSFLDPVGKWHLRDQCEVDVVAVQRVAQGRFEPQRVTARFQPLTAPEKQIIPQGDAEPAQGCRHGRLRQAKVLTRAHGEAVLQHGVKNAQQVEVETGFICHVNTIYKHNLFIICHLPMYRLRQRKRFRFH